MPRPAAGFRGWADRLAGLLAAEYPGLRYANLAVRGKLLRQIVAEQVPAAAAMSPGLVSIAGGGNDILRPGADPDVLAELFDAAVARLRASGSQVLMFTGLRPGRLPGDQAAARPDRHLQHAPAGRSPTPAAATWSTCGRCGSCARSGAWSPDRLHLNAQSHQRLALRACEVLGVPVTEDWRAPLAADPPADRGGRPDPGRLAGRPPRGRPLGEGVPGPVGQPPPARHLLGRRPCPPSAPRWTRSRRRSSCDHARGAADYASRL